MRRSLLLTFVVVFLFSVSGVAQEAQKLEGDTRRQAEEELKDLLLDQRFVSRTLFPATNKGIDLKIDGSWNRDLTDTWIKNYGLAIAIDEPAIVTDIVLKGKHIEIHFNGGGKGGFSDFMADLNRAQVADYAGTDISTTRASSDVVEGLRQPGGSRINLRFDRDITAEDLTPDQIMAWLEPLVDPSALQQAAMAESIPEEFREAAERGEIIAEMSKQTVFAILGEPVQRSVDLETDPPTEKWQYDRSDLTTVVVTFVGGRVSKVDVF